MWAGDVEHQVDGGPHLLHLAWPQEQARLSTRLSPSRPGTEHQHQQQARLHQTSRRARASFGLPAMKHTL